MSHEQERRGSQRDALLRVGVLPPSATLLHAPPPCELPVSPAAPLSRALVRMGKQAGRHADPQCARRGAAGPDVQIRERPPPPEAALERFALEPLKAENAEGRARPSGHGLPETRAAANACRTAWPSPRVAPRPGCRRRPMALTCGGSPGTRQRPLASACGVGSDQGEARGAGPGARPSGAGWEWAGVARLGRSLGFRVRWVP